MLSFDLDLLSSSFWYPNAKRVEKTREETENKALRRERLLGF